MHGAQHTLGAHKCQRSRWEGEASETGSGARVGHCMLGHGVGIYPGLPVTPPCCSSAPISQLRLNGAAVQGALFFGSTMLSSSARDQTRAPCHGSTES